MSADKLIYREEFKIRASEIGFDHTATLPAICNLLQEIAGNHARELAFDITDLHKHNLTWVLHRLVVTVQRYPKWRETITIKTWPSSGDRLRAYRDFQIIDEDGNMIGKSLSYWLIMNIESRRPRRIPEEIIEMAPQNTEHVIPIEETQFENLEAPEIATSFEVRKTDLDLNKHVNNVRYIEWALSCLDDDIKFTEIDIRFKAEAMLGDTVTVLNKKPNNSNEFLLQLVKKSDHTVLANVQTKGQD